MLSRRFSIALISTYYIKIHAKYVGLTADSVQVEKAPPTLSRREIVFQISLFIYYIVRSFSTALLQTYKNYAYLY